MQGITQTGNEQGAPLLILNYAKGGIGNQLFQHVFAHSLAKKLGAELRTDISFYGHDPYGFSACVWNLPSDAKTAAVGAAAGPGAYILTEGQIQSLQEIVQLPADANTLVLNGYWQREALLDPGVVRDTYHQLGVRCRDVISQDMVNDIQANSNAIAVHLRRRDYAHMGLCKDSYYIAAVEHLRRNFPDAKLFVFSDEPNYARHLLASKGLPFTPVASGSDMGDLYLMSLCKHFVLANSSYSWWAAYFGEPKGGLIFCPKEWVTIDATPSPCPTRWVQLSDAVRPFQLDSEEVAQLASRLQKQRFDAAIRDWFGGRGDQTLRVEFKDLNEHSVVFDLGGYKGDWCAEIVSRYGSQVFVFEPVKSFYDQICTRFHANASVQIFHCGLGARNENMDLHLSADGTGAFGSASTQETVRIVEASSFLQTHQVDSVDLMKINIEGGEYELLERLIATGDIEKIGRLQVQFHDFVPDAVEQRARIVAKLAQTHRQTWCFYFVWEEWERLPA